MRGNFFHGVILTGGAFHSLSLLRRAHNLGYEIWMDLFADLKHQGVYIFDGDFAKAFAVQVSE